jgi:hypothetical protein
MDIYGQNNFKNNEQNNFVIDKGTSFPVSPSPVAGQLFFRTDLNLLHIYTGASWSPVGSGTVGKFPDTFTTVTTYTVNHSLGTNSPVVFVYNSSDIQIFPDVTVTDSNNVKLDFGASTTGRVIVLG